MSPLWSIMYISYIIYILQYIIHYIYYSKYQTVQTYPSSPLKNISLVNIASAGGKGSVLTFIYIRFCTICPLATQLAPLSSTFPLHSLYLTCTGLSAVQNEYQAHSWLRILAGDAIFTNKRLFTLNFAQFFSFFLKLSLTTLFKTAT